VSALAKFAFEAGGAWAIATVIGAWTFRSSSAPIWAKIALPVAMMALGISAPWKVDALLGMPRRAVCEDLPKSFELVGFSANDQEHRAYLWIKTGAEPVSYDVPLGKGMAAGLLAARTVIAREGSAHIRVSCKAPDKGKLPPSGSGRDDEQGEAVLVVEGEPAKGADD
jgi:hypothetical protein